jgi:hypothetical protein
MPGVYLGEPIVPHPEWTKKEWERFATTTTASAAAKTLLMRNREAIGGAAQALRARVVDLARPPVEAPELVEPLLAGRMNALGEFGAVEGAAELLPLLAAL